MKKYITTKYASYTLFIIGMVLINATTFNQRLIEAIAILLFAMNAYDKQILKDRIKELEEK